MPADAPHGGIPPPPPRGVALARYALACAGGVGSAADIGRRMAAVLGRPVRAREVRDLLRGSAVQKLGAGLYALPDALFPPVGPWVESLVDRCGPLPARDVIAAVRAAFPNGDDAAIAAWLHEDPGRLRLIGGDVRLAPDRTVKFCP